MVANAGQTAGIVVDRFRHDVVSAQGRPCEGASMNVIELPGGMTVAESAERLLVLANRTGVPTGMVFGNTLIWANPGTEINRIRNRKFEDEHMKSTWFSSTAGRAFIASRREQRG